MRSLSLILWSILLTLIAARYYHRLRHIRLENSFCSGYQELKDNKCSARLSTCSALKPEELTMMRQVLCGFKFDPAVQTEPPPPVPNHGGLPFFPRFHGIHGGYGLGIYGGLPLGIHGGYAHGLHGKYDSHNGHGLEVHGKHEYGVHGGGGHGYGVHGFHPFADVFEADVHQYRFVASIYSSDRKFLCGGALVSPKTVITSAQCLSQMKTKRKKREEKAKPKKSKQTKAKQEEEVEQTPEGESGGDAGGAPPDGAAPDGPPPEGSPSAGDGKLIVRFGEQYLNINPVFHKIYEYDVESVEVHPTYDPNTHQNDIAILRLVHPVPICLFPPILIPRKFEYWLDYDHIAGCSATYMGWGLSNQRPYFRAQTGQVLPQYYCNKLFNWEPDQLHRSHLCVDSPSGVCIGDTGGPLITHNKHGWVLIGILTFGKHCRTPGLPLVFARVTEAIDQIFKYIDQDFNSRNITDLYHHECHHPTHHHKHHLNPHKEYAYGHSHEKHDEIHPIHTIYDKEVIHPIEKYGSIHPIEDKEVLHQFEKHYSVHSYDEKEHLPEIQLHGDVHPINVKDIFDQSNTKLHGKPFLGGVLPIKHINFEHLK